MFKTQGTARLCILFALLKSYLKIAPYNGRNMSQYSADKHNAHCVYITLPGCTEPSEAAYNAKQRHGTLRSLHSSYARLHITSY